ncbi:siderophore ABC transporter substrate-binding protein [Teichococcus oryzae]|nr:ABC transporter substrate-binding protein [Pseudoroseomonas oryzae]
MIRFASRRSALRGVLGLALIPAGLAACARNGGMVVPHAQGEARLSAPPRRIVSYDLGALDMLQALGAGVAAVPAVRMPSYLSGFEADTYPRVGTLFEPDLDALRAARPDLILVGGRSSRQFEALSAIAPTLDLSARPTHFLADVERNLRSLGQVLGREAEAEGLLAAFAGERAALHARSAGAGTGLMLFVAGQGMSVQPPGGRFGYMYDLFGIRPVVAAEEAPAAPAQAAAEGSPEAAAQAQARREAGAAQASFLLSALRRNPDWIFALDRPAATGGEAVANTRLAASEAVRGTTAWRRQQLVMLDAPAWYLAGNGITALRSAVAQFSRVLG